MAQSGAVPGVAGVEQYGEAIRALLEQLGTESPAADIRPLALEHLDGLANREFRRLVSRAVRREAGTFFSSSALRSRAVARHRRIVAGGGKVFDPACGMGDLLLAAADLVPKGWSPERRAKHVALHMRGRDIVPPLAQITAARLALWAHVQGSPNSQVSEFEVEEGDAFDHDVDWKQYALVLLNPPYTSSPISDGHDWGSGKVTTAAPFTLDVLRRARPGATIAAILPDVLRTGSRYARWRESIEHVAEIDDLDIYGRFDSWTDVDVFIAHMRKRRRSLVADKPANPSPSLLRQDSGAGADQARCDKDTETGGDSLRTEWWQPGAAGPTLSDIASVSIGDVVPHRHSAVGPTVGYLTLEGVPVGALTLEAMHSIEYTGRLHEPPFVVLRRTSAPSRGSATPRLRTAVYAGQHPVAVENHLIVVTPANASIASCQSLARALGQPAVTVWLDHRLRMRHLTVSALRELPIALLSESNRDV